MPSLRPAGQMKRALVALVLQIWIVILLIACNTKAIRVTTFTEPLEVVLIPRICRCAAPVQSILVLQWPGTLPA